MPKRDTGTYGILHIVGGPSTPATAAQRRARDATGGRGCFWVDKDLKPISESEVGFERHQPVHQCWLEI